jgi:methanogenic corrinoid protein MtbC1
VATQGQDPSAPSGAAALAEIERALESSLEALDEPAAQVALDRLFGAFSIESALERVLLPFLYRLGERWAAAERTVAQEHFASNVIGGRLRTLARGWGDGRGPRAILACPPGEQHELGLMCFGLTLRERGWRITYLGAETPLSEVEGLLAELAPAIVILAAVTPEPFMRSRRELRRLGTKVRVGIGGGGASEALARELGAQYLSGGATAAAASLEPEPARQPA